MNNKTLIAWTSGLLLTVANLSWPMAQSTTERVNTSDGGLHPEEVLHAAFRNNPTFQAALLNQEKASYDVLAEEGLYPFYLFLDGGFTHSSSPGLAEDKKVSHRTSDATVLGAELSKTLPIGTQTSLRLEGRHQVTSGTNQLGAESGSGNAFGLTARPSVTQPLLRGAGTSVVKSTWRQALKSEALARHRLAREASAFAAEILHAYWELWYNAHAVAIEIRARDLARTQLEEAEERVNKGDLAPVDTLPFQTRLATLEESVVTAQTNLDLLSMNLAELIGFNSKTLHLSPVLDILPPTDIPDPNLERTLESALVQAPEIREKLASLALAEEKAKIAGESLRPRLDLLGWLEANTLGNEQVSPVFEQFGQGEAYSAYVGLIYEMPLDDRRKRAERASARIDVEVATEELRAEQNAVKAELISTINEITSTRRRLALAEQTREVARRQADAERERYTLGAAIFVQVREAEEAVREAELRTARARVDLVQAELNLKHLTGALLSENSWMKLGELSNPR